MIGIILPAGSPESCHPVTSTRTLDSVPVANVPLGDFLATCLETTGFEVKQKPQPGTLSLYLPAEHLGVRWMSWPAFRGVPFQRSQGFQR